MTSKETRAEAADNNKDQLARAAAMREAIRWSRDLETEHLTAALVRDFCCSEGERWESPTEPAAAGVGRPWRLPERQFPLR